MKHLQGTFSRKFNRRWGRTGPLWQSRYQARLIEDQDYFDQVMVYIHLNPVRAGLVDDPLNHVFSGHREIMGKVKKPLADVDDALIGFGDTLRKARRHYANSVRAGLEEHPGDRPSRGLGLLSPPDRNLEAHAAVYVDELGRSTGLERPNLDVDQYLNAACKILDVEIVRLASRRRDRDTAAIRQLVAAVGIERWGQRAGRIAALLEKHPVAVSRWVAEAARKRQADPGIQDQMTRLDKELSKWALAAQASGSLVSRNLGK